MSIATVASPEAAEREIERLLIGAGPLIDRIVTRAASAGSIRFDDMEDVAATTALRLLRKLRRVSLGEDEAVSDLESYVATLTYNVINDHLRRRFPERARLRNRLRYALLNDPKLALWQTPAGLACGLRTWTGRQDAAGSVMFDTARATPQMSHRERPAVALAAIFAASGEPVTFDALVVFTAALWHIADVTPPVEAPPAVEPAASSAVELERREFLQSLWREIRELRPLQRKALLLNLRDAETANVLSLLVLIGIAAYEDVAAALEMTPAELTAIWNELPLDDLSIATRLRLTRQQVINLRRAARERLARRVMR
ncbi:MAG TPA: hypothetical protein VF618_11165 [Thermoanaerobaculia bacterium]